MFPDPSSFNIDHLIDNQGFIADVAEEIRILHIEDNPRFANVVSEFLHQENDSFTVTTATDPREGLTVAVEEDLDCVVSDYEMPGLNGLEVLKQVRDAKPDLPFILYTGKGNEEIAGEAISAGVSDYLQKGGGTDQYTVLANRIENAVAKQRAERQVRRGFSAIETAHDGISLLNEDGEFVYVNQAYADIVGYDRADLIGHHWEILYRDEDVGLVYDQILPQARESGWRGQTVCIRETGEPITVDHTLAYTGDGMLICTISETNESADLQEELSLKERVMDEAPVGITIADASRDDNPLIYANDGFTAMTGYDKAEILGQNCRFLQGEHTAEEPVTAMREAIAAGESVTVELRNYRKDGTEFWNRVRIAPIRDDAGEITHYVGFQEDITEFVEQFEDN